MKVVVIWMWLSAVIMVFALLSPYYQAIVADYYLNPIW